ncbi:MAG: hypothetical protein PHT44_03730 [Candidatus Portnoybacteria bacterium]|nr:hypothetical protein [Candidatus Portnoybacteria bacterium]MDD4983063.1 hypothetical protein [Candidatus Portnoybacteria bacterium]
MKKAQVFFAVVVVLCVLFAETAESAPPPNGPYVAAYVMAGNGGLTPAKLRAIENSFREFVASVFSGTEGSVSVGRWQAEREGLYLYVKWSPKSPKSIFKGGEFRRAMVYWNGDVEFQIGEGEYIRKKIEDF